MPQLRALMTAAAAAAVILVSAPAATADVGTFPGGTAVNVARNTNTRAVFPMVLDAGIDPAKVTVRIVDVRQDDIPAQDLRDAVVEALFVKGLPAIRLRFLDPAAEVGTYDITLKLRQGRQSQFVTFVLTRATAEVKAPSSLTIDHEESWRVLEWLDVLGDLSHLAPTDEPPLWLRVGPHDALGADDFTVTETDSARGTVTGHLVDEDGALRYAYSLDGLPLGQSTQTLEIASPQLAEPLLVTLNVSNRRPLALIGLMVLLGLLTGSGLRRWIEPAIARLEARRGLLDLVHTIKAARAKATGAANAWRRAKMDDALRVAEGASDHATTQSILARTTQVEQLYAAALGPPPVVRSAIRLDFVRKGVATILARAEPVRIGISLFVLRWLRALVLTIVLLFAGFALYADTWTGTWQQLALVLSWAVALDLSTAAVTSSLTAPPATPRNTPGAPTTLGDALGETG